MTGYRIGATLYFLWGILHLYAAYGIYKLGTDLEPGLVQARLFQDAAFMLIIALLAMAIAVWKNWNNDRIGYWLNLSIVSVADIIFLLLVVIPGYVPLGRGLIGPALWVAAVIFSTIDRVRTQT